MNDSARKALMTLVERAVRPLRAGEVRKLRMREELLAHLIAIFEEELARCGDEQSALRQAQQRFGDPRELSKELQEAVPRWDRLRFWVEKGNYQPGESLLCFARRTVLYFTVGIGFFTLLCLPLMFLRGRSFEWILKLHVLAAVSLVSYGMMIAMLLLTEGMRRAFFAEKSGRSRIEAIRYCLFSLLFFPAIAFTFNITLTGDLAASLVHFRFACLFAPFTPLLFILLARQQDREFRARADWTSLEIDV